MLIIGHRGAAGLAPENTLAALQAGFEAGADILEFDVRLTTDHVPVLAHDPYLGGKRIRQRTLADLRKKTKVTTLQEALDAFFGKVLLNIELKEQAELASVYEMVKLYVTRDEDWDNVLFSSFQPKILAELRNLSDQANLALLHHINPFTFMRYQRRLHLAAIGLHRLHVNPLALAVAKELGIFTYVYTVNRPQAAVRLEQKGIDGIATDYPDKIRLVV